MADLFYPQLLSGALAQYPIRKVRNVRTIKNVLADGSMILLPDPSSAMVTWQLEYSGLSFADIQAIQSHFLNCSGPLRAFTFIDPTGNIFASSTDLTTTIWQKLSVLQIQPGASDPLGGVAAQTVTNYGQSAQELLQSVRIPGNYQYCFSLYARSNEQMNLTLFRRGSSSQESIELTVSPGWNRLVSSGRLNDGGSVLSAGIVLAAGQQIQVYGVQLEAQIAPSRYQQTFLKGAIYNDAHWATEQLEITAEDVNSYATTVKIEAAA